MKTLRLKRDLAILLIATVLTLTIIKVGYVMPYKAPAERGDSRGQSSAASLIQDSSRAMFNYTRPGSLSSPPEALFLGGSTSEPAGNPRHASSPAGARPGTYAINANSHRHWPGPPDALTQRTGSRNSMAAPPAFYFPPAILVFPPGWGGEGPIGPFYPIFDFPGFPGTDSGGDDFPGGGASDDGVIGGGDANPPVPIPGAVWLMGSGLAILAVLRKRIAAQ